MDSMQAPNIKNTLIDPERNITYHVMAYRKLSERELLQAVRYSVSQLKRKPKKGSVNTIITVIGFDGRI